MDSQVVIPVVSSVLAAIVSGAFSVRAVRSSARAERLGKLAERQTQLSEPVFALYHELLGKVRDGSTVDEDAFQQMSSEFLLKVQIFGSDRAVRCANRWMQASFCDAPGPVGVRLLYELLLALRADVLGSTRLTVADLAGLRMKDLYQGGYASDLRLPFRTFCKKYGWTPPWPRSTDP